MVAYTKAHGARKGPANNRWNTDRDYIARSELAQREMRSLLNNVLKRLRTLRTSRTEEMLGYSRLDLIEHIEKQFVEGMSWDNRREWHIDHIKPVCEFVREGVTDIKMINALNNLRPLWARDNLTRRGTQWNVL